jgi:hypothetical protein
VTHQVRKTEIEDFKYILKNKRITKSINERLASPYY